jgi:hypothetical protein
VDVENVDEELDEESSYDDEYDDEDLNDYNEEG